MKPDFQRGGRDATLAQTIQTLITTDKTP